MDREARKILSKRLEEISLLEIEDSCKIEDVRTKPWFKEIIALLVVLSACDEDSMRAQNQDAQFADFYRRLVQVFTRATVEHAETSEEITRPVFRARPNGPNGGIRWRFTKLANAAPNGHCDGFCDALLYLMLSDASPVIQAHVTSTVEVPCFLEMARFSSLNNIKNTSIFEEYVALLAVCFFGHYFAENSEYKTKKVKYDLAVRKKTGKRETISFSVKTKNFVSAQLFHNPVPLSELPCEKKSKQKRQQEKLQMQPLLPTEGEQVLVLLHNCSCDVCNANPMRKVSVELRVMPGIQGAEAHQQEKRRRCSKGLDRGCREESNFKKMLKQYEFQVVYLVSVRLLFELRYALCTFAQKDFRGTKEDFKLRDFISGYLDRLVGEAAGRRENRPIRWMQTLVDRGGAA